jgi:hypothetical protein
MSILSEVTILISQRAGDLEKAKDVFATETRLFVSGILGAVKRARSEPWVQGRVRIDLPKEVETEGASAVSLESTFARCQLRFRKEATYRNVADIRFGVEFEEAVNSFIWQIVLVPHARYPRMDDLLWHHWRAAGGETLAPGAAHQGKANTVRFVQRPVNQELIGENAFGDVKQVLENVLVADRLLAEAVGIDQVDDGLVPAAASEPK